ncbi:MAG: DUF5803 family protein [Haloarculaceae archaeon]
MNRRLVLAVVGLGLLAATAGCSSLLGGGQPDYAKLNQSASYDWNTTANATVNVTKNRYVAVYDLGNRSKIELYQRDALGTESPLDVRALKFRYPNGTVTNLSKDAVEQTRKRLVVTLPSEDGKLAYTAPRTGKGFTTQTFVSGSYVVTLPPGARVGVPILGTVKPGGYHTTQLDDRVTITWPSVEADAVSVRWYLQRDLWLFGGLLAIALVLGGGGALYYLRQIRQLERRREETGVDVGDDSGDGGPPGTG